MSQTHKVQICVMTMLAVTLVGCALWDAGLRIASADDVPDAPPPGRTRLPEPARVPEFKTTWAPKGMKPAPKPGKAFKKKPFVRGVAVGLYGETPELDYPKQFKEIKALGATHISLVTAWSLAHIRAVDIQPDPVETYPDARLEEIIGQAQAAGLSVMLFPIIHMHRRRSGEWRGKMAPADPERWWRSYRTFVLHYAQMAKRTGVDVLSVGSELLTLEGERDRWVSLIGEVRGVFKGKLIYSANWDHFHGVTFWDQLDMVGMTGYFELSKATEPSYQELLDTWSAATSVIAGYSILTGRPLILTEVGYPSQIGGAAHPWDYTRLKAPSGEAQYLAYRAMYEAWRTRANNLNNGEPLGLSGVFIWSWNGYGGSDDIHYTPRGKPATAIIRRWYTGR